jgi:hypothetical protein
MSLGFSPISITPIASLPYWSGYVSSSSVITIAETIISLFAATTPFISLATDNPADQPFEGTLEATLRIDRSIIGADGYGGFAETISELSLINADAEYDDLVTEVSINAQPIMASIGVVSVGGIVEPFAAFAPFAELIAERLDLSRTHCTIETRDRALTLSLKPVQQNTYAGTGELEGGTELANKRRPFVDGKAFNISPVLVIAGELLFQCNDGAVAGINAVKDGGASLTFSDDYATVALLRAAGLAPSYYASCIAEGYFRLGGAAFNQVTADVTGLRLTTADIVLNVAETSALQTADQIDQASFDQLNEDQPATVGYYLGPESNETCATMFKALMHGVGGWFGISLAGKLQVRRFILADTFASATYTQVLSSVSGMSSSDGQIVIIDKAKLPEALDPPPFRRRVVYQRNWTVMSNVIGVVEEDVELANQLTSPYLLAVWPPDGDPASEALLQNYPGAPDPEPTQSYFANTVDAENEAERLFTLYSSGFGAYQLTVKNALFLHDVGDVINVTHDRLGLSLGRYLRLVAVSDDVSSMSTHLVGFG